jgi:prolyl oligopeptidase
MRTALFSLFVCSSSNALAADPPKPATTDDPYAYLEDINGDKAMTWVKARNAEAMKELASSPDFAKSKAAILEIMDSTEKIPYVLRQGEWLYNFWKDKDHVQGLWRRAKLAEYEKDKPNWETVLDLDALSKADNVKYVFQGASCLRPKNVKCLVSLSKGGGDASIVREWDMSKKEFVKDGFTLPEAKNSVAFVDDNTIFVGTDFGPGSMTSSGYTRIAKLWKRGTPLSAAVTIYEGKNEDVAVSAYRDNTPGFERSFVTRSIDFYNNEVFEIGKDNKLTKVDIPTDANSDVTREWMLVQPRTPWKVGDKTYASGSLLATKYADYMKGKRELTVLFEPTKTTSLSSFFWTHTKLVVTTLDDVKSKIVVMTPGKAWKTEPLGGAPEFSSIGAAPGDIDVDDEVWLTVNGFLAPTTYMRGVIGKSEAKPIKKSPAWFDASPFAVQQNFVESADKTRVPYFVIGPKDMKLDGKNPTILNGYGGFEVSLEPFYSGGIGRVWLQKGGVFVVANIRGGGEYGPDWHNAAVKANRLRAYEDFAAVAKDLVAKKITSKEHLGVLGGSNGGLLVGNMLTLYPDLIGAVSCEVPLLDMKKYTHMSAGASWIAEYGDPDKPEEWAFIQKFSPYQNVKKGAKYPPVFFLTSTKDDRVGPVHARKMAAKMIDFGDKVLFWENIEGGHGAAADNDEAATRDALSYGFLWSRLH